MPQTTLPPLPLVTSRYQAYRPEWGVAVRITVGRPRFVRYPCENAPALAPHELFKPPYKDIDDIPTEKWVYFKRMRDHQDEILKQLNAIAARHPGQQLVLLCFENVVAGEACHRRWAAEWFAQQYGWDIPEINPNTQDHREKNQLTLF